MPVAFPLKVLEAGGLGMRSARISAPREVSWSAPQRNRVALSMRDVEAVPEPLFTHAFPQSCALAWILESLPCSGDEGDWTPGLQAEVTLPSMSALGAVRAYMGS